jgi:hypothetical protein
MLVSRRTYAGRVLGFALKQAAAVRQRLEDRFNQSYIEEPPCGPGLLSYLSPLPRQLLAVHESRFCAIAGQYLAHRFDLLGSGWSRVRHGIECCGVEGFRYPGGAAVDADREGRWLAGRINRPNLAESQRIWRMIDPGYVPIDWQRDFKSGYRWSESTWYLDIRYGHKPGVDIKVPWELARMQHLPQLAWAYALAKDAARGFTCANRYAGEFRNQVLDFIAGNPPRFGVNWRSAMEVAIRAANWAVAADLFRANGAEFDVPFQALLARSLYEHGVYIKDNLEWDPQVRGNHYLANVAGLLFVAAYLPRSPQTDAWLGFAVNELVSEADFQFAADGTHREASTSYHRLTAEMIAYATALVLALPPDKREALRAGECREPTAPFPKWYFERLERMGEFTAHITKPDGHVPQVGDNDSGRFLRFDTAYAQMTASQARAHYENLGDYHELADGEPYWDEDHLDHRGLLAAIGALMGRDDLLGIAGEGWLEGEIIWGLAGQARPASYRQQQPAGGAESVCVGSADEMRALREELSSQGGARSHEIPVDAPGGDLRDGLACYGYPDFGLYILRSRRLYLAVRCGRFGLVGNGGHAHHDQLSIELSLDGRNLILDPGTYVYSAIGSRRKEFRGAQAHFAPQLEGRQAQGSGTGLFEMRDRAFAQCLYFGRHGFAGSHRGFGPAVYRIIEIGADTIRITDGVKGEGCLRELTPAFGWRCGWRESPRHSPGYGIIARDAQAVVR